MALTPRSQWLTEAEDVWGLHDNVASPSTPPLTGLAHQAPSQSGVAEPTKPAHPSPPNADDPSLIDLAPGMRQPDQF